MKQLFILFLIIFSFCTNAPAQEVKYKNVIINFKDQWKISQGENGELIALKEATKQAFIVSMYYPKGIEEGKQYLIASQEIPKQALVRTDGVKLVKENVDIKVDNHLSFQGNVYMTMYDKRFLISVSLGSNAGILLVTYEGEGNDIDKAIQQFKTLAHEITLEAPKDGLLFNQNDLLKKEARP